MKYHLSWHREWTGKAVEETVARAITILQVFFKSSARFDVGKGSLLSGPGLVE